MQQINRVGGFVLLAVACLTIMVGCVIVPGLTGISDALGVKGAESWLVTLPSLGVVVFGPLAGRFIEKAGLFMALCLGLFLYGLLGEPGLSCRDMYRFLLIAFYWVVRQRWSCLRVPV